MSVPAFAVVGHPNKGKSSIVATLARDDTVGISPVPGTTVRCRHYPMAVDGETLYVLIDTPGFQRPRKALAWMQAQAASAADRPAIVREFVTVHRGSDQFPDECELLTPILDGAGILYVTDGSRPYGPEYEAEMEILRWTGSPSMALINRIGSEDHVGEWRDALGQYFRIVRVFDAMKAPFDKRIELLRAFGELEEQWRAPLDRAVGFLFADRNRRRHQSARAIARMLTEMLTLKAEQTVPKQTDMSKAEDALRVRYLKSLRRTERICRNRIETLHDYHTLERSEAPFEMLREDLFSERSWRVFGLTRRQLVATGAVGGATAGAAVDLAAGGATILAGAGIGGLIGGIAALISFDQVAEFKVLGQRLGGILIAIGPTRNIAFPWVVLGRALWHYRLIEARTHARRDRLNINDGNEPSGAAALPSDLRASFDREFRRIRRGRSGAEGDRFDELAQLVERAIAQDEIDIDAGVNTS